jgi:hypothetical protein
MLRHLIQPAIHTVLHQNLCKPWNHYIQNVLTILYDPCHLFVIITHLSIVVSMMEKGISWPLLFHIIVCYLVDKCVHTMDKMLVIISLFEKTARVQGIDWWFGDIYHFSIGFALVSVHYSDSPRPSFPLLIVEFLGWCDSLHPSLKIVWSRIMYLKMSMPKHDINNIDITDLHRLSTARIFHTR